MINHFAIPVDRIEACKREVFQVMCDVCGGRMYGVIADLRLCFRHWSEAADGWSQERVEAMEAGGWWKWQIRKVFGREQIYEEV